MAVLLKKRGADWVRPREITEENTYLGRREFLRGAAVTAGLVLSGGGLGTVEEAKAANKLPAPLVARRNAHFSSGEEPTGYENATRYNNFYEFGTDKTEPARYARHFATAPWTVRIDGEVAKAGPVALEDLLKPYALEERVYRLRCVEAWSMVIPWIGIPLSAVLKRFEPTSRAKFVEFRTLYDPERMPGQRRPILRWPYREGLRIDEAMHPLTLLAVGMYGRVLPNQNGAPLRLVVPWKYGFKSIKSIVHIRLVERQPATTWNEQAPREYGFYANVNPAVDHPRWSQKRERRIGEFLKRPTLPFNGYAEQVAGLYAGMDLSAHY